MPLKYDEIAYYFCAFIALMTGFQVIFLEIAADDVLVFQIIYYVQFTLIYGLKDLFQVIFAFWYVIAYLLIIVAVFTAMAFYWREKTDSRTAGVRPPIPFFNLNLNPQVDYQDINSQYPMTSRVGLPGNVFMYSRMINGKPVIELRDEEEGLGLCSVCRLVILVQDHAIMCPSCRNYAHLSHLKEWLKVKGVCPICREKIVIVDLKMGHITEGADFSFINRPISLFQEFPYQDTDSVIRSNDVDVDLDDDLNDIPDLELNYEMDLANSAEYARLQKQVEEATASRIRLQNNINEVLGDLDNLEDISQEQADEILKRLFPDEDDS